MTTKLVMSKKRVYRGLLLLCLLQGLSSAGLAKEPANAFSSDLEQQENLVPVLIIGGGPAGFSAAIYAARSKLPTLLLDDHIQLVGGSSIVENWPGIHPIKRADLFRLLKEQAERFGAHVAYDPAIRVDLSRWPFMIHTKSGETLRALSLIIATGSRLVHAPILNESMYWGKGVAPCSYCDAPRAQGKDVIVCGEGIEALLEALNIAPYARKILLVLQAGQEDIHLSKKQQERLDRCFNMNVQYEARVMAVDGDGKWIKTATVRDNENKQEVLPVDMLFVASSRRANSDLFQESVPTDKNGYIQPAGRMQEVQNGIFVAGEAQDSLYRQAAVASGDGIKAAIEAIQFMQATGFDFGKIRELKDNLFVPLQAKIENELVQHMESVEQMEKIRSEHSDSLLVVMFHAHGCHYCQQMSPIFQSVAALTAKTKKRIYCMADVQDVQEFVTMFKIEGVPLIAVFHKGELIGQKDGLMTEQELIEFLNENDLKVKTGKQGG